MSAASTRTGFRPPCTSILLVGLDLLYGADAGNRLGNFGGAGVFDLPGAGDVDLKRVRGVYLSGSRPKDRDDCFAGGEIERVDLPRSPDLCFEVLGFAGERGLAGTVDLHCQ